MSDLCLLATELQNHALRAQIANQPGVLMAVAAHRASCLLPYHLGNRPGPEIVQWPNFSDAPLALQGHQVKSNRIDSPVAQPVVLVSSTAEEAEKSKPIPASPAVTAPPRQALAPVAPSINRAFPAPSPQELAPVAPSPPAPTPLASAQVAPRPAPAEPSVYQAANPQPPPVTAFPLLTPRPVSGSQLYQQRLAALRAGTLYTRLAPNQFQALWQPATTQPTYQDWLRLLHQEAQAMVSGQGQNRLTVIVGDSLSLWIPPEWLPRDRFWLNQSISGDTTGGVLRRLPAFDQTHPDTIHVMVGVNDLKNGVSDAEITANLRQIVLQLKQNHPGARIVLYSILPTRLSTIPTERVRQINEYAEFITRQQKVEYLDLQDRFVDGQGHLRPELTTDGLHLSPAGYQVWQQALATL